MLAADLPVPPASFNGSNLGHVLQRKKEEKSDHDYEGQEKSGKDHG